MKERKLHIETPPIIGYLHHAYHLSVAQEHPQFLEWFNCNYIHLKYYPLTNWLNFFTLDVHCDSYPLIELNRINNKMIGNYKINIIDFIVDCINDGYYVWLFVDEYYMPNRRSYKLRHFIHECLVYGYSLDECIIHTVGFNSSLLYSYTEVGFNDIEIAFNSVEENTEIKLAKYDKTSSYEFDIKCFKNSIEDYLKSTDPSDNFRMTRNPSSGVVYGIDIYNYLKKYYENPEKKESFYDIRPFHILWEHKKCMVSRIKYLCGKGYSEKLEQLLGRYNETVMLVEKLRNLQLKYRVTNDHSLINNASRYIFDEIESSETKVLEDLLNSL